MNVVVPAPPDPAVSPPPRVVVPDWLPRAAISVARLLPVLPLLALAAVVIASAVQPDSELGDLDGNSAVLLGNAALFSLAISFAVAPVAIVTGWRWHQILARDFGLWTLAFAGLDLVIAATTSSAGWRAGVAGQAFLAAATTATLLLVPLAVTSNRWSMRRLGREWKVLHRLVYVVIALIGIHLLLLPSGPQEFALFVVLFGPSLVLRVPPVRRRVIRTREALLSRVAQVSPKG